MTSERPMADDPQARVLKGIAASPGVAIGAATVIDSDHLPVPRHHVDPEDVEGQIERLRNAIEGSRQELEEIRARLGEDAPADYRLILDAHLMMHSDELLIDIATHAIRDECISAEWAVERAVHSIKRHLEQAPDPYFRDRAIDVQHVGKRIHSQLVGRVSSLPPMGQDAVLVIDDLHPADAAHLLDAPVAALVTGLGSATSHTAILARTLEIPSVVGVPNVTQLVGSGDRLVVDGLHGRVVLSPDSATCQEAEARGRRYQLFTRNLRAHGVHSVTLDGVPVEVLANVDLPSEVTLAVREQAPGIGLYRTEFLFMNRQEPPSEDEQLGVYRDIARVAGSRPVVLRSFDIGGDNLTIEKGALGLNPALGLRAIRLALARPEMFRTQLRAVLKAATAGDLRLLFPLVSGLTELRRAKQELARARAELEEEGAAIGSVHVGAMIELPAAVVMADRIAAEVDFMAVGTNDLVQYSLAVDRTNPQVAYLADALDPAVLRQLDRVISVGKDADRPVSMCGDMATDPVALPIVAGLGFRSVSVPIAAMPLAREILRAIDTRQARGVVDRALACDTALDVRVLVRKSFPQLDPVWQEAGIDD
ncbi:MAG: phosphoenolpyruvate--protein phosphotransferase [Myxococcales bacterium]|nr:phosphoenolpyruvate--protein phosphotransferase [Myxococcales bacterium]MDD9972233.1 phosphoenolpyruvate--protein phosphotransferase [Myxococcales bacterium]